MDDVKTLRTAAAGRVENVRARPFHATEWHADADGPWVRLCDHWPRATDYRFPVPPDDGEIVPRVRGAYLSGRGLPPRRADPDPARITLALDARGLDGPNVDLACGVTEPAVDEWESGARVPTEEQVRRLATLTGYPVAFFYDPCPSPTLENIWICGARGCAHSATSGPDPCPTCGR